MKPYPIPAQEHSVDEEIQRSRFRTTIAPAETVEQAQAFVQAMRVRYGEATHNCWAYLVGPPGSSARIGMSDDGEPHGTAGRPMLQVLTHGGVGDIVAVVTRWYGGTKLGKGGLARAYSGGVQAALENLPTVDKVNWIYCDLIIAYPKLEVIKRLLPDHGVELLDEAFGAEVTLKIRVPDHAMAVLGKILADDFHAHAQLLKRDA